LLLWNNDLLLVAFLTLFFVPFLGPLARIPVRDVTLGFIYLVELGNEGSHVAVMNEHDNNKEDWSNSSVSFTMMTFSTSMVFTLSPLSLSLLSFSLVFSLGHTSHERWLFIILFVLLFLGKVAALENGCWEFLSHINWSASCLDSSADAP